MNSVEKEMMINAYLTILKKKKLHFLGTKIEGLIHNLNTPLNTIVGYAQILKYKYPKSKEIEKITKAARKIDDQLKIFHKILDLYHIKLPCLVNFNNFIEDEINLLQHSLFFKHQVDIELILEHELPNLKIIYSDFALIWNLILENIQTFFSNADGIEKKIFIITYSRNGLVYFKMDHYGKEVPSNILSIFQNEKNRKNKIVQLTNFGTGLPIILKILETYDGDFILNSESNIISSTISIPYGVTNEAR
ncbi:MAG: hypothetical protein K8S23_04830 [Candidatus Cloacimonetes bacterium]|nr:hypothetical protein [Candidatus Cloacimonadota bacterium]